MLQLHLGEPIIARTSDPHTSHRLGKCALDARAPGILLPELRRLLFVSPSLQGFMSGLGTHM